MGGFLGSITVLRPLSRFDTHPQAKLKTFKTKMAAVTQSTRSQRSYGKNGELSIVQLPMPIPTSFLVSGAVAQKFCLECRTHSLNGKQCINTQSIYSSRCIFFVRNGRYLGGFYQPPPSALWRITSFSIDFFFISYSPCLIHLL